MAKKKMEKGTLRTIIMSIIIVILAMTVIGVSIGLSRQITTKTLGTSAYTEGSIGADGKASEETKGSLYTKDFITVDGLKCDVKEDGNVTYQVFYYDKDQKFISASDAALATDLDTTTIPEGTAYCRIVITPTKDDDGKIGFFEKGEYVEQRFLRL